MLWKMLIHGLIAAILIGSAAAVYAQAKDAGSLSQTAPQAATAGTADGYVRPAVAQARKDGEGTKRSRDDDRDHDDDRDDDHDD